jgi:hypothetical protein
MVGISGAEQIVERSWGYPKSETPQKSAEEAVMLILGLVLLVVGLVTGISILWTIGVILVVLGAIFWILGSMGHAVAGRRHYW